MGYKTSTPLSLKQKMRLIYLAFFDAPQFASEEDADNQILAKQENTLPPPGITAIRRGLVEGFQWSFCFATAGGLCGWLGKAVWGVQALSAALCIVGGTVIILWSTLAMQGWKIQTWDGVTLTERVNQWIFRLLYSIGTFLIVAGTTWTVLP